MHDQTKRLIDFLRSSSRELVAIFDIGTRATRLLVAPAEVPQTEWVPQYFFNTRDISRIGGDVSRYYERNLEVDSSAGLERAIQFIAPHKRILTANGISENNIHAVGTAVFRWLENQSEVLSLIQQRTGVKVRVLSDRDEAQLSLAGIAFTHDKRPGGPSIGATDCIMLIDQGGGSTEVSYSSANGQEADLHSFDDFGTVALRNKFFTMGADGRVDPANNRRRIVTQLERITALAEENINTWGGYPELLSRKLHVYGMGSAITNCYPGTSNFKIHNKLCSIDRIKQVIQLHADALDYSKEQILTLWKRYTSEEHLIEKDAWDNLENRLLAIYGLPVFVKLLEKFRTSELRICGYGLRYAYYLWKYHYRVVD
jgi:exopolyphosphatase/pppGpp-phosphohydrolase